MPDGRCGSVRQSLRFEARLDKEVHSEYRTANGSKRSFKEVVRTEKAGGKVRTDGVGIKNRTAGIWGFQRSLLTITNKPMPITLFSPKRLLSSARNFQDFCKICRNTLICREKIFMIFEWQMTHYGLLRPTGLGNRRRGGRFLQILSTAKQSGAFGVLNSRVQALILTNRNPDSIYE